MKNEVSIVRVLRSNEDGNANDYDLYEVPYDEKKNVMQVLLDIFTSTDRSIAFRRNRCNRGMCGSCTMIINGSVKRACITRMTKEITIEPVGKYELIKDLVVNFSKEKQYRGAGD